MKLTLKKSLLFAAAFFAAANLFCAELPAELDGLIRGGVTAVHSLRFEDAEKDFSAILQKYPGQPYGYFGMAVTAWARHEYISEQGDAGLEKLFESRTTEALKKGEQWLEAHPTDAHAYMCVGGMYGLKARLSMMKHRWLKAYFDGRKGINYMDKAIKLDPKLYDAYLGPGMFQYYAGTLPGIVQWLAKFIVKGDAKKGIEDLKLVKEHGRINATIAELLLIEIYTQTGSKYANPALAVEWSGQLKKQYPAHPMMQFVYIVSLYEDKQWDKVIGETNDYIKRINEKAPYYLEEYRGRALVAQASAYFAQKKWSEALRLFTEAAATMNGSKEPKRWAVWALVRLGQIYDLQGHRDMALGEYKKALKYDDLWGFKKDIKAYLSKPYALKEFPGQLPPP